MKVGLTATMIQGGRSGVAQYVFSLVKALLDDSRVHLHLFILADEMALFSFAQGRCEMIAVSMDYAAPVKNIWWHQTLLPRIASQLKLDLLHVPSYRRLIFRAPCPTIGTIHDLAPFHIKGKYDLARMFYGRVIVKALAKCQSKIIAISQCTARDIEHFFGIPMQQLHIILNGIDHERFHPADTMESRAWVHEHYQISSPYFLYVSRLEHPAKNHVRLIEAFETFKKNHPSSYQLVLGGGNWHGSETIRARAADSPYADEIRFLGFVPDENLAHLYRAARAMVYPSLFEGFGLPPVEAMACGTPVISSTRGALEEVVADAAVRINPEDADDIAAALQSMADDDGLHAEYQARGLINAQRFHWHRNAAAVVDVYQKASKRE